MKYQDLYDFISQLEARGELIRVTHEVNLHLEMIEICDHHTLRAGGLALLFKNPKGSNKVKTALWHLPLAGN